MLPYRKYYQSHSYPLRSRTSYKSTNLFNKGIIIGREQQFLCKPGWNPSRRLLGGSSTSFQPYLLYQITLEKRKCYFTLDTFFWIKEYGQASRPISTD